LCQHAARGSVGDDDPWLWRGLQASGGIAISGLPDNRAVFNATYAPTGERVAGYPSFSAGPRQHLCRHPERDEWWLASKPFPRVGRIRAKIPAAGGPVPTGARAWTVSDRAGGSVTAEVAAREVA
jgi:hypothetical protein